MAARLGKRISFLDSLSARLGWTKLAVILTGVSITYLAFHINFSGAGWTMFAIFLAGYSFLARRHSRIDDSIKRHTILRRIKATHAARLKLDWSVLTPPIDTDMPPGHPFASDLNLTGKRSLHRLIDTSITLGGGERLRSWLLQQVPDIPAALERAECVKEMKPMFRFRDRLALTAALVSRKPHERWELEGLLGWLDRHTNRKRIKPLLIFLGALSFLNITLLVLFLAGILPAFWIPIFIAYFSIYMFRVREFKDLFEESYYLNSILTPVPGDHGFP